MHSNRSTALAAAAAILTAAVCPAAWADTLADFLTQGSFTAQLRTYYFRRDYATSTVVNANAFAVGGLFNYQTAQFLNGFSVGASFFTANALDTHNSNPARIDTTLVGTHNAINSLGQAFLQYDGHGLLMRVGNQLVTTPWANPSDGRVIPATYQAAYGSFTPVAGLTFEALRILRYKGRTADGFFKDNNYYPATWDGDANYGGTSDLPPSAHATDGTAAFGIDYAVGGLKGTAWYYHFYDFAHMLYAQADETLPLASPVKPFAGAQVVREWGSSNIFADTGTHIFGQPGTSTDNLTLGGIIGLKAYGASLSVSYDHLESEGSGALGGGALISPYTASYATDPLYTSSMIRGMVELGPGNAWKVTAGEQAFQNELTVSASFAQYRTDFNGNDSETYLDLIYLPPGWLKGLSLRNRLEIGNGRVNPGKRHFVYNRLMVAYSF
ncbi:MAG: OprD family outer membrane porin [Steroidobacteraceae bacterium]